MMTIDHIIHRCIRHRFQIFLALGTLYLNFWITSIAHHFVRGLLAIALLVHAPSQTIDQLKTAMAWTWELSFTQPSDWLYAQVRLASMPDRVDVVLAHYKEDLGWLKAYLSKIDHLYLYCKHQASCQKGLPEDLQGAKLNIVHLPNEGRETHSYLTHIISHYNAISERTVFSLASLNGNWMRQLAFIFALTETKHPHRFKIKDHEMQQIRDFHFRKKTIVARSLGDGYVNAKTNTIQLAKYRPLYRWMMHYFKQDLLKTHDRYGYGQHGAIFSAKRHDIVKFSKPLYQQLLNANRGGDSMEAGYYMERLWRFMYADRPGDGTNA
jgi:hypothetical protein